jgi:hypothetical protein
MAEMTDQATIARLKRAPVIFVVTLALLMAALLIAERGGTNPTDAPREIIEFVNIKNTPAPPPPVVAAKPANPGPSNGNHEKHCNDGKGKDDPKNKHCRDLSGT